MVKRLGPAGAGEPQQVGRCHHIGVPQMPIWQGEGDLSRTMVDLPDIVSQAGVRGFVKAEPIPLKIAQVDDEAVLPLPPPCAIGDQPVTDAIPHHEGGVAAGQAMDPRRCFYQ